MVGFVSGSASSSGSTVGKSGTSNIGRSSISIQESTATFSTIFAVDKLDTETTPVTVDDEYCRFNATETKKTGCEKPRNCRACLRVAGCMVGMDAQCVSAALHYNASLDFRAAKIFENESLRILTSVDYWNTSTANGTIDQKWIFPSTMVDYCGSNDTACELCRATVFQNSTDGGDMRFCVGTTGCVCIDRCDGPYFDRLLDEQTVCVKIPFKKSIPPALMWVIGSSVTFVLCSILFYWVYRKTRQPTGDADDDRVDTRLAKDSNKSSTSHSETPVMELSVHDFPRFTMESSRWRGMHAVPTHEDEED